MQKTTATFKKILVVDDDGFIQYAMKIILSDLGCDVETADNGFEALIKLEKEPFDLIFSDINMPIMNGYELAKAIRTAKGPYRNIPIIGVSACTEAERQKALGAGMNQLFEKPIHPLIVRQIIFNVNKLVCLPAESLLIKHNGATLR